MLAISPSRIAAGLAAAWALSSVAAPARAEPAAADRAAAEVLFREAKQLMLKKQFDSACPKLEESQRLDPQGGTLLNLAVCHARQGRTASAWVEFQDAQAIARDAGKRDRVRLAERELRALEKKLSRLTIEVPASTRVKDLKIERGTEIVGEAAWGTAVPVDPGEVTVKASAPKHRDWTTTLAVAVKEQKAVTVPALERLPDPPPPPQPRPMADPAAEQDRGKRSTHRTIAYVAGGVGLVAVGVGSYFGLRALSKANESDDHCNGTLCDEQGLDLNDQADRAATVSNVAFGVGLIALGAATYFYLTSASDPAAERRSRASSARLIPSIGPGGGGIVVLRPW